MKSKIDDEIARSLETPAELLPLMSCLLADLDELGCSVARVVEMIRRRGLERGSRAIDFGCGKGAMVIALAEQLGLQATGVDAFAPFIEAARQKAKERGVEHLCRFRCSDMRDAISDSRDFDLAMIMGVGPLLGDLSVTTGEIRKCVRTGGLILIDDGFIAEGIAIPLEGYEEYADYDETIRRLESHGDRMIEEHVFTLEETEAMNDRNNAAINRRAERLIRERPEAEKLIRQYLAIQEKECAALEEEIICAIWLIERS